MYSRFPRQGSRSQGHFHVASLAQGDDCVSGVIFEGTSRRVLFFFFFAMIFFFFSKSRHFGSMYVFLQAFNDPKVKAATKMNLSNLAMVFAPTLLQCSSDDAPLLMGHLQAERSFVSTLISEVELSDEDLCIINEATR